MKKKILLIVMAVAVMWNVSGCGRNHGTTDGGDTVSSSENNIEETGDTQEGESGETGKYTKQPTLPYISQNYIYRVQHGGENLLQSDLDGKTINRFPLGEWEDDNLMVSDQHICYMKGDTLCVSQIRQTDNGEEVLWKEREKIVEDPDPYNVALFEPYLIYVTDTVYRYNLNTGETLPLGPEKEFGNVSFQDNWWLLPAVYDGKMYMDSYSYKEDEEVLYQIDIEKWEARKVYTYEDEDNLPEVIGTRGDLICLNADTEARNDETKIVCFNAESDTKTVVTGEEISAVLEKEGLWEEDCKKKRWRLDEDASFSYGDRIYMLIHMSWFRKGTMKKWGEKGKTKVKRSLILSCPWDNIKDVTYEKEISEWWYDRAERNTDWGEYDYFEEYSAGGILTLYNDELYVHYSDDDYHIAAYHMGTGTWRELDEREAEYRLMYWSWDDGAMDD